MKITLQPQPRGIALIMVMIIVVVFSTLAAGFAFSMKVEMQLARNSNRDTELEWMGRSGIELAKYILASSGAQGVDALNAKWAGGIGDTNDPAASVPMDNYPLGAGSISIKIIDCDRKFNINRINPGNIEIVRQACILMGVDAADTPRIANAILDWVDTDDSTQIGTTETESDYYLTLNPPYEAKNAPIDDLSELLSIHYITPGMYYGSRGEGAWLHQRPGPNSSSGRGDMPTYPIGFVDLFTTLGSAININTASSTVLQLIPEVDGALAQAIITARAGPDGAEGTEDDMPFRNIGEMANIPGMRPEIVQAFSRFFSVRSSAFEVRVEARVDNLTRVYHTVLVRGMGRDLQPLYLYWK